LNFLRSVGAVKIVYATGDRRTHYQAVAELRNLVIRFLHEKLIAHLDTSRARLERIAGLVKQLPPDERARLTGRVKTLQSWENNVRRFLPRLARMLAK
jgi:DNA-binding transcriptional regulator GbsR (MarR family)